MKGFKLNDYPALTDGEIEVVINAKHPADKSKGWVPAYEFAVRLPGNPEPVGNVFLRIGNTKNMKMYGGHIAYGIKEKYRGHHYAAKACKLVKKIALDHGLKTLWITCNPDNYPSRKTCEALGCELVEIVDLPEDIDMYQEGERQKCRYKWSLTKA
jgi:predicted acetyltransferase